MKLFSSDRFAAGEATGVGAGDAMGDGFCASATLSEKKTETKNRNVKRFMITSPGSLGLVDNDQKRYL